MIPIKVILIIFLLIILRAFLVQRELILVKRVVAFLMFFVLLFLVLFPDISTQAANIIGVGRGVDLIFYFSHLFVLFLIVGLWRRSTVLMATVTKLARSIALQNSQKPHEKNEQTGKRAV
jgi:hypothetical protein